MDAMQVFSNMDEGTTPVSGRVALRQLPSLRFSLQTPGGSRRDAAESYIRARFAARHGARISHFLPNLITLGNDSRYCAAVGLASAASGPVFAETYLDAPVERLIAQATGATVERRDILEIGNLVSTWKGSSLLIFVFLTELIARLGHRWVLFTATREVEALLARLQYAPVVLAAADPARLPDGGTSWGTYYERQPRVMFGDVPPAVASARQDLLYRMAARAISGQVERVCAEFHRRNPQG
jgi:hypothetical protein